jgi:hypothetical protein
MEVFDSQALTMSKVLDGQNTWVQKFSNPFPELRGNIIHLHSLVRRGESFGISGRVEHEPDKVRIWRF